ncbi:hypothetical protein PPTG_23070 [Phytophthora nicotianae INRA-310]|uniref:Uncharacterized protein n=1 Tax=Phytophthora nicotianae (strain INRA-310) TaxID=761204 RepID=W2Q4Q8_PHYN3|nr:hypothetical protein PPTG_23070 [Phytophthora nicotianae INRA-310]ETN08178.1 hypothetical protein PPTG_23070 [Phytophthora nicotianae INRA-310]
MAVGVEQERPGHQRDWRQQHRTPSENLAAEALTDEDNDQLSIAGHMAVGAEQERPGLTSGQATVAGRIVHVCSWRGCKKVPKNKGGDGIHFGNINNRPIKEIDRVHKINAFDTKAQRTREVSNLTSTINILKAMLRLMRTTSTRPVCCAKK